MPEIEMHSQGPINDLFLALNYYISTGDHVGEGVAYPLPNGGLAVLIAYAPRELEDADNWRRLEARLEQIRRDESLLLRIEDQGGTPGGFRGMAVIVALADLPRLTYLLKAAPGPLGWGSMRSFLAQHGLIPPDPAS